MIRKIEEKDAESVCRLCESALGHKTTAELIRDNITKLASDNEYFIAVYDDGGVKGFIQAQRYDILYGESGYNIIALAVMPDFQKRGIGKKLLSALENYAKKTGASFVRLNSRIERNDAHAFYEHLGYTCDKTQKRFIKYI